MNAKVGLGQHNDSRYAHALSEMMQVCLQYGSAGGLGSNDKGPLDSLRIIHPLTSPELGEDVTAKIFGGK